MTKFQQAVDVIPFIGLGLIALIACLLLVDVVAAVGLVLKLLEVHSVFDRLLPGWNAMHFLVTSVIATATAKLLGKGLPD